MWIPTNPKLIPQSRNDPIRRFDSSTEAPLLGVTNLIETRVLQGVSGLSTMWVAGVEYV
jgi:hypothetical protein